MDALPSAELSKKVRSLAKRWIKKFDDMSTAIATKFTQAGRKATDSSFQQSLKDAGWAVDFQITPVMRDAMNATIAENVALIKSIPRQYALQVEGSVMRGFTTGRDLKTITDELTKHYDVSHNRAAFIARDQCNKLTATVTQARRVELGLFEAEWVHSGGGRVPRASHVKAGKDRKRFDVREGCYIDGEHILPGVKPNCRCSSRTVLPF
ncbi:Phage Mu protein F like protein [compost metagenome]